MTRPDEPQWPTPRQVRIESEATSKDYTLTTIRLCREAWLASVDSPETDPVGTVREGPDGVVVVKRSKTDALSGTPWLSPTHGYKVFNANREVKGWPVIGACPGTEAAHLTDQEDLS